MGESHPDIAIFTEPVEEYDVSHFIEESGGKIQPSAIDQNKNPLGQPLSRNSTSFASKLSVRLHQLHEEYLTAKNKEAEALKYHQWLVVQWMSSYDYPIKEARGLLVYHMMGLGKTRIGAATLIALMDIGIYPIFIAPKSLQNNMMTTIREVLRITRPEITDVEILAIQKKITVVSSDAYNMFSQITRHGAKEAPFDNKVLIVDEAHDLFRAIINSGNDDTNSRKLYGAIMAAKNVRLLFLTGTPLVKNVFEMVPMINMLAGKEVLPIQYDVFMDLFVDIPNRRIKNREKLQNRLFGLVSFTSTTLPLEPNMPKDKIPKVRDTGYFPELFPLKIIKVEMSESQYKSYLLAREKEELELAGRGKFSDKPRSALSLPSSEMGRGLSTYYVKSRMISDFNLPEQFKGTPISSVPDEIFNEENSPKLAMIAKMIMKSRGSTVGYSQFVDYGLGALGRFLQNVGLKEFKTKKIKEPAKSKRGVESRVAKTEEDLDEDLEKKIETKIGGDDAQKSSTPQYALLSGRVEPSDRIKMQVEFNDPANKNGDIIKFLGFSATGAQGLDLHNAEEFYGFEPYWTLTRLDQAITRIYRIGSHDLQEKSRRQVQPYLFLSVANKKIYDGIPENNRKETMSIDEKFYERSVEHGMIIEDARKLLQEVSIECVVNGYPNCRHCSPTDKPLFHDDVRLDVKLPDPCEENKETEVEVKKISLGDEQYYYNKQKDGNIDFYQFDDELNAYMEIPKDDPIIEKLMKLVK